MARFLESEEVARRLGIKRSTLYAYVSRGLLRSHPSPGGRRSLFDADDVERLARRSRTGRQRDTWSAPITTGVTQLREDGPCYRGTPLAELLGSTFEDVAELLWQSAGPDRKAADWTPRRLGRPPALPTADLLRWAVVMAGARDPLRADLRAEAVCGAARRLIAAMVGALPPSRAGRAPGRAHAPPGQAPKSGPPAPLAEQLTWRLAGAPVSPRLVRAVDAALVALADHELATSTMAVRLAASAHASLYDAVLCGLGPLAGPLHGGATPLAHELLRDAERRGAARALDHVVRWRGSVPGFGHALDIYRDGDPRFAMLWSLTERLSTARQRETVTALLRLGREHGLPPPNVDLALATLLSAARMDPDSGAVLFTVARMAGWTAHYLEELLERPLRFRVRAVYAVGPPAPPG